MLNLLQSDLYKLKKSRYFMVCLLLNLVLAAGTVIIIDYSYKMTHAPRHAGLQQAQDTAAEAGAGPTTDKFPRSYEELSASSQMLSFFSGENTLLLAVVISLFAGGEFTYGTIRTLASRNYSRYRIYASKFIVSMLVSILFAALYALAATMTATYLWGFGTTSPNFAVQMISGIALELFLNAAFAATFLMFSILIRQNGGSLAVNICFSELLSLFAAAGELLLRKLSGRTIPLSACLLNTNMQAVASQELSSGLVLRALAVGFVYLVLSTAIGAGSFARREIQ